MDKSPDAFRTISEVAEELDLPQHVLRFWETRFPQIKPLKRGGGRRYYRPGDVDLLKGIRKLLYGEGYTIRGVQRIFKSEGVRFIEQLGRGEVVLERRLADAEDDDSGLASSEQEFDEDTADDDAPQRERNLGDLPRAHSSGLDLGQLQAALDELRECRRLLDALRDRADYEPETGRG